MITQVCNLSCDGCTNYSDLPHKGYVKWKDGKFDLEKWLNVVNIPDFGIMGGEPLINPQVRSWITGVRELMPNSQIRFTTNGVLLHKHLDIIDLMHSMGNYVFKITIHTPNNPSLIKSIKYIQQRFDWKEVIEHGISRWKTTNNFRLQINKPDTFIKSYKGDYKNMHPYKSNPLDAFNNCCQPTCPLLYKGKIYKCSTAGLLKDTVLRNCPSNIELWDNYIDIGIDTHSNITKFIDNFGKPNNICAQCPTSMDKISVIDHVNNVVIK